MELIGKPGWGICEFPSLGAAGEHGSVWYCEGRIQVPEISRFFGIVVQMYYADHDPPHFHVGTAVKKHWLRFKRCRCCAGA